VIRVNQLSECHLTDSRVPKVTLDLSGLRGYPVWRDHLVMMAYRVFLVLTEMLDRRDLPEFLDEVDQDCRVVPETKVIQE